MAKPTGTFQTYDAIGNREDLEDIIYDISPMERPFMSNIARGRCSATYHEWQVDTLASASATNTQIEGNDATTDTTTATARFGNYTQISDKVPRVTGTQRAVTTAGRADEMSYQMSKRGRELGRDIEAALCGLQAAAAGTVAGARAMGGIAVWLWDNNTGPVTTGTTYVITSGAPTTIGLAGTAYTFTEAKLKTAIAAAWDDGGDPNLVLLGSHNKQLASSFGGIATQYRDNPGANPGPATIIASADVYVSDFGQHNIVASRFTPAGSVYVLDTEYWEVCYLRPIQRNPLAKTGDSDRTQILAEYTLAAHEPKANAKVYTTTTS